MGWFYGFTLHLVVNDRGELLAFQITPGNADDRRPVDELTQGLTGKLVGDISQQLFKKPSERSLHLITKIHKNMHNKLMPLNKLLLRKQATIETTNDPLKNIEQVEHTRHRSVVNAMVNVSAVNVSVPLTRFARCYCLDAGPLRGLGMISYGFYIYHLPCLNLMDRSMAHYGWDAAEHPVVFGVAGLALSVLVATVSFIVIERPAMNAVRRFT